MARQPLTTQQLTINILLLSLDHVVEKYLEVVLWSRVRQRTKQKLNEGGVPTCFVGTNFHVLQTLIKSDELALELDELSPDGLC